MRRVFLIAAAGRGRERLEELLGFTEAEIVGRAEDLRGFEAEAAETAEILVIDGSVEPLHELLETMQETGISREAQVIVMTDRAPALWVNEAIRAGVRAVVPFHLSAEQLATLLDAITQDLIVLHPESLQPAQSTRAMRGDAAEIVEPLTTREREVLQLLARGLGNKEIAGRMNISEHTVKFHVASILGKLNASTRTEAVSVGLRRGLVLI